MSEGNVDLSQIRGDWKFHMDYLTNAVTQTMARQMKLWGELSGKVKDTDIDRAVKKQTALWAELNANVNDKGTILTTDARYDEFIQVCNDAKVICDELQGGDDSLLVEEFSEACRQTRALCDDLVMMQGQRPDDM